LHADRRTDMAKLVVSFRNFTNAHQNFTVRTSCSQVPAVPAYRLFLTGTVCPPGGSTAVSSHKQLRVVHLELSAISDQSPDISDSTVQSGTVTPVIPFQYTPFHSTVTRAQNLQTVHRTDVNIKLFYRGFPYLRRTAGLDNR